MSDEITFPPMQGTGSSVAAFAIGTDGSTLVVVPNGDIVVSFVNMRDEIERLRAGGCARDQRLTQHCAEAAAAHSEIERLRARVAVLEKVREAAQRTQECWGVVFGDEVCLPLIDEQLGALRAALKEAKP